jgi:hypothetical protein
MCDGFDRSGYGTIGAELNRRLVKVFHQVGAEELRGSISLSAPGIQTIARATALVRC